MGARIGLFGGAFDPIHNGHLGLIDSMLASGAVDELHVVPTFAPPHRPPARFPFMDRLRMARLALQSHADVRVLSVESRLPRPSYTLRTLEHLRSGAPGDTFFLCIGFDSLATFNRWHRHREILKMCSLLVASRPGTDLAEIPPEVLDHAVFVEHEPMDLSSTQVREKLQAGEDLDGVVPQAVLEYLREEGPLH